MMQELLLSTNAPCMSCLPQRSYTLIVEALDFNNETSGKYFSLSGIAILPSVHFFFFFFLFFFPFPLSQQCLGGVSLKVREGS